MSRISETQMPSTCLPPVFRPLARLAAIALSLLALSLLIGWAGAARAASDKPKAAASFAEFDRRARAGGELTVVFFGASLTWGANATDQALSSYRAYTKDLLEARYPKARFRCYDAAIGGTGSQLGAFRLDRDVLARRPDLVFLDFSANDDNWNGTPLAFASYESLLRRIIRDGRAPVVAVMFPFQWEIGPGLESGTTAHLKGLSRRKEIAAAYGAPAADAAALIIDRVRTGETTLERIWDTDGVHPGDLGYLLFAEAAFAGFEQGVRDEAVCAIPEKPLSDGPFMTVRRAVLAELFPADTLPADWAVGKPHLTGACHDQMMSRWLDRLLIASHHTRVKNADGREEAVPREPARLRFEVRASYVMAFGEATLTSGKYRVFIDGKPHTYTPHGAKEPTDLYDMTSARFNGNWNYHQTIVENLDPNVAHVLEIEPVLDAAAEQELRIESLCVAGGPAEITPLPPRPPAAGTFRETGRCGDIVCLESDERVAIANSRLRLEFDRATGAWEALPADGVPAVDWTGLIKSKELKGFKTVRFEMPADGSIALQIRAAGGTVVRQLLNSAFSTKGQHEVKWGGLYQEFFGPTSYGALGGAINPRDPMTMVGQGCEWKLDPKTGEAGTGPGSRGVDDDAIQAGMPLPADDSCGRLLAHAIALQGGGSATLVMAVGRGGGGGGPGVNTPRPPPPQPRVLNRPSDGRERAVGNDLAVVIRPE